MTTTRPEHSREEFAPGRKVLLRELGLGFAALEGPGVAIVSSSLRWQRFLVQGLLGCTKCRDWCLDEFGHVRLLRAFGVWP